MTTSTEQQEKDHIEALFDEAMAKIEAIRARHKAEMDALVEEVKNEKIKKLRKELSA